MANRAGLLIVAAVLGAAQAADCAAQDAGVAHAVSYIEVLPAQAASAAAILGEHAQAVRAAHGNLSYLALRRRGRGNHFAIVESWVDADAMTAYAQSPSAESLRARLAPLLYSPPDSRAHSDLITAAGGNDEAESVYVLTHVDVFPANTAMAVELLRSLAIASRTEPGNLRFDVLVSARPNHMTLVEAWQQGADQERHVGAAHTLAFRRDLAPLHGALYDERIYDAL